MGLAEAEVPATACSGDCARLKAALLQVIELSPPAPHKNVGVNIAVNDRWNREPSLLCFDTTKMLWGVCKTES